MNARDVMVSSVITVKPNSTIKEVATLFLQKRISGAPVVDDHGALVGIISEGDLLHRAEAGTEKRPSWWLAALTRTEVLATDYVKSHSYKVADVMTRDVITAPPGTPLREIATLLEKHAIKRVPIVDNGQLVGIVSRANLIQALASTPAELQIQPSDTNIRERLLTHLREQPWANTNLLNVTVTDGVVHLWGLSASESERQAIRVAAETIPGVRAVDENISSFHRAGWA